MHGQQLTFSLIFISLGAILGWFAHSTYNNFLLTEGKINNSSSEQADVHVKKEKNELSKSISKTIKGEINEINFSKLLESSQYDKALQFYQQVGNKKALLPILLESVKTLTKEKNDEAFIVLDVFLKEFYDSTELLISKANALTEIGEKLAAYEVYYLAKSYASNEDEYNQISQLIHNKSIDSFKQYEDVNQWQEVIVLFSLLADYEPQYPFYNMALGTAYSKTNQPERAVFHLESISENVTYGQQADKLLDELLQEDNLNGISLINKGEHYSLNAVLADYYSVQLMIDTGASYSSLSSYTLAQLVNENVAQKIGKKELFTASGKITVDIYQLKKMTIGKHSINDIVVAELDLESSSPSDQLDGLLGINFLSQFDFSIDQKNQQLMLSPKTN